MKSHKQPNGVNLSEMLIVLAVLGVIAGLLLPVFFSSKAQDTQQTKLQSTQTTVQSAMQQASSNVGLLPMSQGPGTVLSKYLNATKFDTPAYASVPSICKNLPPIDLNGVITPVVQDHDSHAVMPDGTEVYGLHTSWDTGIADALSNQLVDPVCILTR